MLAATQTFRPALWQRLSQYPNLSAMLGFFGVASSMGIFKYQVVGLWGATFGYPLLAVSMALLVAGASIDASVLGKLKIPGVSALAAGSYSLYLSHKLVYKSVKMGWIPTFYAGPSAKIVTALFVAGVVGLALYALIERPFLKLRDRWFGRSRSSLAEVTDVSRDPVTDAMTV